MNRDAKDVVAKYVALYFLATLEAAVLGLFTHLALPQWGFFQEAAVWWVISYLAYRVLDEVR